MEKPQIINTADGSKTLYLEKMQEQYHSVNGAMTESEYVFIQKGYDYHTSPQPRVLEIGFGTGLNCLLTAIRAKEHQRKTLYITTEKYPLDESIIKQLNYGSLISEEAQLLFQKIHSCEWGKMIQLMTYFQLLKLKTDITKNELIVHFPCHIIYFDAFAPDKQPEIWTSAIFGRIFDKTCQDGVFVTYSAKGAVRRQLSAIGFMVERLPGPPGKKEMLRGIKSKSNI